MLIYWSQLHFAASYYTYIPLAGNFNDILEIVWGENKDDANTNIYKRVLSTLEIKN